MSAEAIALLVGGASALAGAIGYGLGAAMAGRSEDAVYERGIEQGAELERRARRERLAEHRRQVATRRKQP